MGYLATVEEVSCIEYSTMTNERVSCKLKTHAQRQNEQLQRVTQLKCMNALDPDETARLRKSLQQGMCAASIQKMYRCLYGTQPSPSVFAVAIQIMETALLKIRHMQDKYLTCFSAVCVIIASKFVEDDQHDIAFRTMVSLHSRQWTANDLRRMELRIMQVVNWSVPRTTYLDFIPAMKHLLMFNDMTETEDNLVYRMGDLLLASNHSWHIKPAALAFALLLQCPGLDRKARIPPCVITRIREICQFGEEEVLEVSKLLKAQLHWKSFTFPGIRSPFDYRMHTIPEEDRNGDSGTCGEISEEAIVTNEHSDAFTEDTGEDVGKVIVQNVDDNVSLDLLSGTLSLNMAEPSSESDGFYDNVTRAEDEPSGFEDIIDARSDIGSVDFTQHNADINSNSRRKSDNSPNVCNNGDSGRTGSSWNSNNKTHRNRGNNRNNHNNNNNMMVSFDKYALDNQLSHFGQTQQNYEADDQGFTDGGVSPVGFARAE